MGRPLTTLTMAQGARLKKNQEIEPISRFIGLFRKGVPHGRALVIGEDGKQVKVHMQIFGTIEHIIEHLLSTFMIEGVGRVLLSRPA